MTVDIPGRSLAPGSEATKVEVARAAAEVAASVMAAQMNPRDPGLCLERMRAACKEYALAAKAFYAYPQAGETVEGPTVVLMRNLAAIWGNLDYGTQELSRDDIGRRSEVRAFCRDLETNVYKSRTIIVPHVQYTGKKERDLTKVREIDQNNNSVAGRAEREQLQAVMPTPFVGEAIALLKRTLEAGDGRPVEDRAAEAVAVFGRAKPPITLATLEGKVGKPVARWDGGDVARLEVLFRSLRDREITREEAFPGESTRAVSGADLRAQAGGDPGAVGPGAYAADVARTGAAQAAAVPSDDEEAAAELDRQRFADREGAS